MINKLVSKNGCFKSFKRDEDKLRINEHDEDKEEARESRGRNKKKKT